MSLGDVREISVQVRVIITVALVVLAVSSTPLFLGQVVEHPTTTLVVGWCFVGFVAWALLRVTIRPPYRGETFGSAHYPASVSWRDCVRSRSVMNVVTYPVTLLTIPLHMQRKLLGIFLPILLAPLALYWSEGREMLVQHQRLLFWMGGILLFVIFALVLTFAVVKIFQFRSQEEKEKRESLSLMTRRYEHDLANLRREALASGESIARAIYLLQEGKKGRPDPLAAEARRLLGKELERLIPNKVYREAALYRGSRPQEASESESLHLVSTA